MEPNLVERIANALLYEGYMLYPYRPSAIKNRHRFNFGVVYPQDYGMAHNEPFCMQTELLVAKDWRTALDVRVRFLHLTAREGWQEAVERELTAPALGIDDLLASPRRMSFVFPQERAEREKQEKRASETSRQETINGEIEIAARQLTERVFKVTARILNLTPLADAAQTSRDEALARSLVSTHTILSARGGEFISLLDPPESLREMAESCRNICTYPVLVGVEGELNMMLSSPIILYDYPQIAPESPGDLFDGTEIDEMLTLRILTLTDEEKREMRQGDARARQILKRTEALPAEQLMRLHGVARGLRRAGGGER
jgi:hypothetical protein